MRSSIFGLVCLYISEENVHFAFCKIFLEVGVIPWFKVYFDKLNLFTGNSSARFGVVIMPWFRVYLPRRWRSGLERSPCKRKSGYSNPSRDRPKSLKPVVTTLLSKARQQVWHESSQMTILIGCPVSQ